MQGNGIGLIPLAQPEAGAVCPQLNGIGVIIRMAAAIGNNREGNLILQAPSIGIIGINYRTVTPLEQQLFRLVVIFHGTMIVQVILRQVGKHGNIKVCITNALLHQSEGGNLHHHIVTAGICHLRIQLHQIIDKRCGVVCMYGLSADFILNGSDQSHSMAIFHENMLDQIGNRCFSVGAGDTDEMHLPFRVAKPCSTELSI